MNNTLIIPLGRRILVRRVAAETKSQGGIYLPDTSQEKQQEAEVLALGTGRDEDGHDVAGLFTVQKGDKVLIAKYGGTDVKYNGEDVLIVNETDVLAILRSPAAEPLPLEKSTPVVVDENTASAETATPA